MALLVGLFVEAERLFAVYFIGNDRFRATAFQPFPERRAVISLVAKKFPRRLVSTD